MRRVLLGLVILAAYSVLSPQDSALRAGDLGTGGSADYYLTKQHGPYLIIVGSFVGDDARDMALKFLTELRTEYKLQAYLYSKSEQERAERDRLLEEWKRQNNNAPARKVRIVDEYTVLIGHYKTMEAASSELPRIKRLEPPSSVPKTGLFAAQPKMSERIPGWWDGGKVKYGGAISQFSRAFVVRNPLLPPVDKASLAPSGELGDEESALLELNAGEQFSLMKCKKPWTLLVSVRGGAAIMQSKPSVFDRVNPWTPTVGTPTQLSAKDAPNAAAEARKLAEVLRSREFGYEAWVLHSRGASFVTVGGFSAPNDPEMFNIQRQLARMSVGGMKLLDTPMPMPVPSTK